MTVCGSVRGEKSEALQGRSAELRLCSIGDDFLCIHPWLRAIDVGERPIHFAYNAITSGAAIAYAAMAGSIC